MRYNEPPNVNEAAICEWLEALVETIRDALRDAQDKLTSMEGRLDTLVHVTQNAMFHADARWMVERAGLLPSAAAGEAKMKELYRDQFEQIRIALEVMHARLARVAVKGKPDESYHPVCSICRSRHGREVEHPCE